MSQSLTRIFVHIVFSTKNRDPLIDKNIEEELFKYLAGIYKQLDCHPIIIGGYKDHVHTLCLLSKKVSVTKILENVKKSSSKWIKTKGNQYKNFYWQDGYAIFSVKPTETDLVKKYIANQELHHSKIDFQDECRIFYKKYSVEYDEKYVWR